MRQPVDGKEGPGQEKDREEQKAGDQLEPFEALHLGADDEPHAHHGKGGDQQDHQGHRYGE